MTWFVRRLTRLLQRSQSQSGFGVLELVCAAGVLSFVAAILSLSVFQVSVLSQRSKSYVVASHGAMSLGYYFYNDVMMAQTSDLPENGEAAVSVTFAWMDSFGDVGVLHTASYYLSGDDLIREYDGVIRIIARRVESVLFWSDGLTVYMSFTPKAESLCPDMPVAQTYQARMRAVA